MAIDCFPWLHDCGFSWVFPYLFVLLQGDLLITTCEDQTTDKDNVTIVRYKIIWVASEKMSDICVQRIIHYENTPIQTYGKIHLQKLKIFG